MCLVGGDRHMCVGVVGQVRTCVCVLGGGVGYVSTRVCVGGWSGISTCVCWGVGWDKYMCVCWGYGGVG